MFRRKLVPVWIGIILLSGMFLMGQEAWGPTVCVDFEDLPLGSTYDPWDEYVFTSGGMTVWIGGIELPDGSFEFDYVEVQNEGNAGGSGQEIWMSSANAWMTPDGLFRYPYKIQRLTLRFGEYGGNVNLMVNELVWNIDNLEDIHGTWLTCDGPGCSGNGTGTLTFDDNVQAMWIGGQQFVIDDVCWESRIPLSLPW